MSTFIIVYLVIGAYVAGGSTVAWFLKYGETTPFAGIISAVLVAGPAMAVAWPKVVVSAVLDIVREHRRKERAQ